MSRPFCVFPVGVAITPCSPSFAEHLSADHRVLVMDWRGHGKSQKSDRDFGFAELADDALAVIEASGAQSVVPIAQGQAPWVNIELRRRLVRASTKDGSRQLADHYHQ